MIEIAGLVARWARFVSVLAVVGAVVFRLIVLRRASVGAPTVALATRRVATLGAIASAAMLLRQSFQQEEAAARIEGAVHTVLAQGARTADILEPGTRRVGTNAMGDAVVECMRQSHSGAAGRRIASVN